jgi:hypothetical protein
VNHSVRLSFALLFLAGCGIDNAVVGGRCRDDLAQVDGRCVAVAPPNVNVIDPGNAPPAPPPPPEVTTTGDAGPIVVGSGSTGVVGSQEAPDAGPPPALVCDGSLVACHGACIPVDHDGANCGACGKICPSNICVDGACVGSTPGDIVLVGHDFTNAWSGSAQAKVLVNAAAIPTTDPIRILSFEDGANAAAVTQAKSLVMTGVRGRGVSFTRATALDLESTTLALAYDVVILHDGSSDDPTGLGARWNQSLPLFAKKGGVVIALDGAASHMPELVTAANLLHVDAHTALASDAHLLVSAPNDVVGAQVLSPYAAFGNAVSFSGLSAAEDTSFVIRDETTSEPVVVHRTIR